MQIGNLSVLKIPSKHEGGVTPSALQTQEEIKHCTGASALIVSGGQAKIQCIVSQVSCCNCGTFGAFSGDSQVHEKDVLYNELKLKSTVNCGN